MLSARAEFEGDVAAGFEFDDASVGGGGADGGILGVDVAAQNGRGRAVSPVRTGNGSDRILVAPR